MFEEQLDLFTYATGLPVRPESQNRRLDSVALDVLVLNIAPNVSSDSDCDRLSRLLACSVGSSSYRAEDQPWNYARSFGRITVSVYDIKGEHEENARESFDVDHELMCMEETCETGHKLLGRGLLYGRYGFIVSVYVGEVEDNLLM